MQCKRGREIKAHQYKRGAVLEKSVKHSLTFNISIAFCNFMSGTINNNVKDIYEKD